MWKCFKKLYDFNNILIVYFRFPRKIYFFLEFLFFKQCKKAKIYKYLNI